MRAGDLRHRVTIQAATTVDNAAGEPVPTWADVATVDAAIRPSTPREVAYAQGLAAVTKHTVTIRYRPGVTPKHRLKFCGRVLSIAGVIDVEERNVELQILCSEAA